MKVNMSCIHSLRGKPSVSSGALSACAMGPL